ncbi:MAG: lysine transporter LysE [Bacillales bacterium]|jgi:L-lysine exporter family protein LysE/ArgO|nr:lysine transporter LysE [Bacillales bacterium]
MIEIILHATLLALGLIMPLGAQNVFVFQQGAIQSSFWRVLPVVIVASICDTILITLAVTGVSVLVLANEWIELILMSIGVLFLLFMGLVTWRSEVKKVDSEVVVLPIKKQIIYTASISILNPHAILDTIGVIGTSSLQYSGFEKIVFSITCIIVSWIWFGVLALLGRQVGRLDNSGTLMRILNRASALIMWGLAIYLAINLLK